MNLNSQVSPCKTHWSWGEVFLLGPTKRIIKDRERENMEAVSPAQPLSRAWPQRGASYFETTVNAL